MISSMKSSLNRKAERSPSFSKSKITGPCAVNSRFFSLTFHYNKPPYLSEKRMLQGLVDLDPLFWVELERFIEEVDALGGGAGVHVPEIDPVFGGEGLQVLDGLGVRDKVHVVLLRSAQTAVK